MSLLVQKKKKSLFFAPSYLYNVCPSSASAFYPMGVERRLDLSSMATWGKIWTMSTLRLQCGGLV